MTTPEERPLSVAELLARNGTIGSPPVGGRRRRKRRNSDGVSVAELTGEIPVVRTGEIPVVADDEYLDEDDDYIDEDGEYVDEDGEYADYGEDVSEEGYPADQYATEYETAGSAVGYTEYAAEGPVTATAVPESSEMVIVYTAAEEPAPVEEPAVSQSPALEVAVADAAVADGEEAHAPPPRSNNPVPQRGSGPELSHDPRPRRRSSDAEQMAYDPVDESVSLADLVEEHAVDAEELRSYLRASEGTLFSGGTVADDLARRGLVAESDDVADSADYEDYDAEDTETAADPHRSRGFAGALGSGLVAILQSLLAVVFGAGLFIAFDQLWRWNNLVALVLTVLVVVALAGAVRMLRKTEDIVSTLTAVAVGLLVTLGPLALQN